MKLALITGATSGIGEAFVHLLAEKKVSFIITGRNVEKLDALQKRYPELCLKTLRVDLNEDLSPLIDVINEHRPDLVLNNAGLGSYGEGVEIPLKKHLEMLKVNIDAVVLLTVAAGKALKHSGQKGTILNLSSSAAFLNPFPLFATYSASKAFVNSFSETMDFELQPYGIRVLACCPGQVETEFATRAAEKPMSNDGYLAMTPEFVAKELWLQIERGERIRIIDWRYRIFVGLAKILPKVLVAKILEKNIQKRL